MKIVVIGSGLIGVTTAYFLRRQGHEVTVLERRDGPGQETSFANGALLTPSMSNPWNAPGCWRVLVMSLARPNASLQLRLRALPALARWGTVFLRNSRIGAFERNTLSNLRLALYSRTVMAELRGEIPVDYGYQARGTMRIFRSAAALEKAGAAADRLASEGLRFRRLSADETIDLNPALAAIHDQLSGALHYESDETGDAYRFCVGLAHRARQLGVVFSYGTEVSSLDVRGEHIAAVVGKEKRFVADRYIVAAGSYSTRLLQPIGIGLPVRPAKGYSLTFPCQETQIRIPVVDDDLHAAIVPLQNAIRVAGTAEFTGYDLELRPVRIRNLLRLLKTVLPHAALDPSTATPWCGLRPMSADGVPVIGATPFDNLLVNTGHGHLGWTLAAGSARLLTDLTSGNSPTLDPAPFALARFD